MPKNPSSPSRSGGWSTSKKLLAGLVGVSFLVFVAGSFVFAYFFLFTASAQVSQSGIPKISVSPLLPNIPGVPTQTAEQKGSSGPAEEPADKRRINILLLGVDQRDDERGVPTRSDSMIVVSIDQDKKTAAMISFPRDLWVEIPGFAPNRLNVPNFLGDANKVPGGGPALAMKTMEHNFGLKIDYYARVNFRGFEKIVDTLGGVTIDVERAIVDNEYPTEDYETMRIYIPAGVQHMNGKVALQYARSRHSESDFGRAKRQQMVLLAIREKALALDVIPRLPSLMGTLKDMVDTDIPPQEILRLAVLAKDIDSKGIGNLVIDDKLVTPFRGEGGADLLSPNTAEIKAAIAALLSDPALKAEAAKIEVANGSGTAGLATKTGEYLMSQGVEKVTVTSADRNDYKKTQIILNDSDKKTTAVFLADALGLGNQTIVPRGAAGASTSTTFGASTAVPDILVILGQDFNLPE